MSKQLQEFDVDNVTQLYRRKCIKFIRKSE